RDLCPVGRGRLPSSEPSLPSLCVRACSLMLSEHSLTGQIPPHELTLGPCRAQYLHRATFGHLERKASSGPRRRTGPALDGAVAVHHIAPDAVVGLRRSHARPL